MPKPSDTTLVHAIVHEGPNKIWVVCDGTIHSARWRSHDTMSGALRNVVGNEGLLHAALLMWDGRETFSTTFEKLEEHSQGYGAWSE
jgi:hypothetical protein